MVKVDVIKAAKVAGLACNVAGILLTGWSTSKDNDRTLAKLVEEALKNKN